MDALTLAIAKKRLGIISVRDYGATGDGTTDDRAAIQAALDSINSAGGGALYFPNGTYLVSGTLTVYSNISLVGQSRWKAVVKLADAAVGPLFDCSGVDGTPKTGMVFENLHLQHKLAIAGSPTADGKGALIFANYSGWSSVKNCVFSNYTFAGISLLRTKVNAIFMFSWQIQGNVFNGNVTNKAIDNSCYYGVWCETAAEYVDISGNMFFYMQEGVRLKNTANMRIVGNTMDACNHGVKHESDGYGSNGKNLIANNTINHGFASGIWVQVQCNTGNVNALQSGCIVSNNIILLPAQKGIVLQGGLGHVCTGNKVIVTNNAGGDGITLTDNGASHKASYCLVANNVVQSNVAGETGTINTTGATGAGNVIEHNVLVVTPAA